jgi:hypothetical protein
MAASGQAIWVVLLAGSVLLSLHLAREWTVRVEASAAVMASGLLGFACLSVMITPNISL